MVISEPVFVSRRGWPGLLVLVALMLLVRPSVVTARPTSAFGKGLSPAAIRILQRVQRRIEKKQYRASLAELEKYRAGCRGKVPPLLDFVAGNLNFQLERFAAAAACYRRAVAAAPEFDEAREDLGVALLQAKRYREAVEVLLEAASRRPEKAEKLKYQAALGALYGEDFRLARRLLRELVAAASQPSAECLQALIQAELQLKLTGEAQVTARRLTDLYPGDEAHWRLLAEIALAAGYWREALSAYKVLAANHRLKAAEYRTLAGIYQQLELPEAAARAFEKYLSARPRPTSRELKTLIGLYRRAGRYDLALAAVGRLARLVADADRLAFLRGEILYQAGRWHEARRTFSRVVKLSDRKKDGLQHLLAGYCAWNENDFAAAARAWERAARYPALRRQALSLLDALKPWLEKDKKMSAAESGSG